MSLEQAVEMSPVVAWWVIARPGCPDCGIRTVVEAACDSEWHEAIAVLHRVVESENHSLKVL